jgi:ATP-dependent HslUV protease ATP-binding subunit HslU
MVGPTGCGKTEIARRVSLLSQAPFIKVEATKFTEVGFHGRDVDQIIRDLVEASMTLTKKKEAERLRKRVQIIAEDRILDILTGPHPHNARESFRQLLNDGALDDRTIEVEIRPPNNPDGKNVISVDNLASMQEVLGKFQKMVNKRPSDKKKMPVHEARPLIEEQELEKLMETVDVKKAAIAAVEESGIVFIDEIDKICSASGKYRGADASAEGVQRDLLPIIEGSTVNTKYGNVNTDYILFIASGAFHHCKPSDLLAELQGRLPIRVQLQGLTEDDMYRILTEPVTNLVKQQVELMRTEGIQLIVEDAAIREIARVATQANELLENIGARRLHTIIERIMETISFEAPDMTPGDSITISKELVEEKVSSMLEKSDLSKYIL